MGLSFEPNYYIDITEHFPSKVKAIKCHKSQNPEKFIKAVQIMNSYRAAQFNAPIGCYSECYRTNKTFPFGDLSVLLPNLQKFRPYYVNSQDSLL